MSVNQSGLRRTLGKNEADRVSSGVRTADLIAGAFYLGLNVIGILGEFTKLFTSFGSSHPGLAFLYKTFCYPQAFLVSRLFSLKGDVFYVWVMAQLVFILTAFVLWLAIIIFRMIFRILSL